MPQIHALPGAVRQRKGQIAIERLPHLSQVAAQSAQCEAALYPAGYPIHASQVRTERVEIHILDALIQGQARRAALRFDADVTLITPAVET